MVVSWAPFVVIALVPTCFQLDSKESNVQQEGDRFRPGQIKLTFGRQVTGTLKGYDQLLNLVLDEAVESLGTAVMPVSPTEGTDEIPNPLIIQLDGTNPLEGL
ncbi:hypothetical protein QQ045_011335 [Rhodiola kirilowii]